MKFYDENANMTYKETLFFIAKCLTIFVEKKNKKEVEKELIKDNIDWDAVVKVSTSHFVFPALYCNLKRVGFLKYIPDDLSAYMKYITDLNRQRNNQIITQAKEVNNLLLNHNITPIFIKGTSNILTGLYEDIAERMVGDIDLLFSKNDFFKAIEILKNNGYSKFDKNSYYSPNFRHYPGLVKPKMIATIEIHKEVLKEKFRDEFNYKIISKELQKINNFTVLGYDNQLSLSVFANQINDYGFKFKKIALRSAYDVFLLSKKVNTHEVILQFNKLKQPLNYFLASCSFVFGDLDSIDYFKTKDAGEHLKLLNNSLIKSSKNKDYLKLTIIHLQRKFFILYRCFVNEEYRGWLFKRLMNNFK
jgi:hypothetical protein